MRRIVLIAVLFSGIITACSKQEIITNYVTHEETQSIFEGIAEYVNSSVDLSACKKIKAQIDDVVPLGGEEGVLISDMLDNRFINPSALSRALIQTNSVPSTRSGSDIIQYIIDKNIQVYWPYSDGYVNFKMIIE
ncbi:MAG: hypothetical protein SPL26_09305 [Bacteroidales bacterium]|nr:hypothetical protein [Bacteroidales bacterium]